MRLLVNLRGTSGAGKTFIVRKFFENFGERVEHKDKEGKIIGVTYEPEHIDKAGDKKIGEAINRDYYPGCARITVPGWINPIFFIGNYRPECGGLDTVPTQEISARWAVHHLSE